MKQLLILPLVAGVLVTGCAPKPGAEKNLAIDPSNMDTTVAFMSMRVEDGLKKIR